MQRFPAGSRVTGRPLTDCGWRTGDAGSPTLYADVRAAARADRSVALAHWRAVRESLYRTHPQSPVPVAERAGFHALHFESDGSMRFDVTVRHCRWGIDAGRGGHPCPTAARMGSPTAASGPSSCRCQPDDGRCLCSGWRGTPGACSSPSGTRPAAMRPMPPVGTWSMRPRVDLGGDPLSGRITIDFDYAFHPSCAFDPRWACPLAPPENWLDLPIRAGERLR